MECSRCGSKNMFVEMRSGGIRTCLDCGLKEKKISYVGYVVSTMYEDRQYKNCKCCVCHEISKCTPSNDFYSTQEHGEGLVCEKCFYDYLGRKLNNKK